MRRVGAKLAHRNVGGRWMKRWKVVLGLLILAAVAVVPSTGTEPDMATRPPSVVACGPILPPCTPRVRAVIVTANSTAQLESNSRVGSE